MRITVVGALMLVVGIVLGFWMDPDAPAATPAAAMQSAVPTPEPTPAPEATYPVIDSGTTGVVLASPEERKVAGVLYSCDTASGYEPVKVGFSDTVKYGDVAIAPRSRHEHVLHPGPADTSLNDQVAFTMGFGGDYASFRPASMFATFVNSNNPLDSTQLIIPVDLGAIARGHLTIDTKQLDDSRYVSSVTFCVPAAP